MLDSLPGIDPRSQLQEWLSEVKNGARHELLFEIETSLLGLDRFIRPGELPILSNGSQVTGYKSETAITVRALGQVLVAIRKLRSQEAQRIELFRRFVEESLLKDRARDVKRIQRFNQDDVEQSFSLLEHTIEHLVHLGNGLLKAPEIASPVFFSYGEMLRISLSANRYFNPFRARGFSHLHDQVHSPPLRSMVRSISHTTVQTATGLMLLSCLRLLHYLSLVDLKASTLSGLQDSLPLFALLRSDMAAMRPVFEEKVPGILQDCHEPQAQDLRELADSLMFQFSLEGNKVFRHILGEAAVLNHAHQLFVALETAHGVLRNFVQQSVVWMAQVFDPKIQGETIFQDFISRKQASLTLRENLWIFRSIITHLMDAIQHHSEQSDAIERLQKYQLVSDEFNQQFLRESVPSMRATDIEAFRTMCSMVSQLCSWQLDQEEFAQRAVFELHKFKVYLDTTLQCIEQRHELIGLPLNEITLRAKVLARLGVR